MYVNNSTKTTTVFTIEIGIDSEKKKKRIKEKNEEIKKSNF